jgi:hypothetical protein
VIETSAGEVIATADSDPIALFALNGSSTRLRQMPAPQLDDSTGVIDVAAGPGGIGASVYSDDVTQGSYLGADAGATVLRSAGVWSTPAFVPLPASTPTNGPGDDPVLALPTNGSAVLALTIGTHVELTVAPSGGAFGNPRVLGRTEEFGADVLNATSLRITAVGPDAALTWLDSGRHLETLHVATQASTGPPVQQALGPIDQTTTESLAAAGDTAAIVWISHHHLRIAFAFTH